MTNVVLRPGQLDKATIAQLMQTDVSIALSDECLTQIARAHQTVNRVLEEGKTVYGINTGFGQLANTKISKPDLKTLQRNLILSHATGVGAPLPESVARLSFIFKLNSLARGYSGVSLALIEHMLAMFNHGITPVIPEKGSVGASGDLVPLAHLARSILGEGEVYYQGQTQSTALVFERCSLRPFELGPKEGLALINGMQVSNAIAYQAALETESLLKHVLMTGALTNDCALGSTVPFDPIIHQLRGHQAQSDCAQIIASLLEQSSLRQSHQGCEKVQDPYSLRCQPQVMGACLNQLRSAFSVLLQEANGVSDNPIVDADSNRILSGGNFHGEIVAMAADNLALAIAEIGALSERRIAFLIDSNHSGLPAFLIKNSGLNSGFMIAHVTAAACASDNKALAHPHSVDSLPTSANQEDHVSMATNGARRLMAMLDNTKTIIAIELLAACQALEFHRPLQTTAKLEAVYQKVRTRADSYEQDRYFADDINQVKQLIDEQLIISALADLLPVEQVW